MDENKLTLFGSCLKSLVSFQKNSGTRQAHLIWSSRTAGPSRGWHPSTLRSSEAERLGSESRHRGGLDHCWPFLSFVFCIMQEEKKKKSNKWVGFREKIGNLLGPCSHTPASFSLLNFSLNPSTSRWLLGATSHFSVPFWAERLHLLMPRIIWSPPWHRSLCW